MRDPSVLVGTAEPPELKAYGSVSQTPEKKGVDVLWFAQGKKFGMQRKEVKDLLASIYNGRLMVELSRARTTFDVVWLLVEGTFYWGHDGKVAGGYTYPWSRKSMAGFLNGVQASGVWVAQTGNLGETVEWVDSTVKWTRKNAHTSLMQRPKVKGEWGKATSREWLIHLLQSFDDVGPTTAAAIIDAIPMPLGWKVTEADLLAVPGIGKKTATRLIQALTIPE